MELKIGVGKYDITGPCANLGFMGMSNVCQTGRGIHTRVFSRAFVIEDLKEGRSIAVVCADLGVCPMAVKQGVVKMLAENGPMHSPGNPVYNEKNVMIAATHTHSAPGGYSHFLVYNASILGFNKLNFECVVKGIFESIKRAHESKSPGKILIAAGNLHDCGKIRSVNAYLQNPEIDETAIDKDNVEPAYNKMTLLKFIKNSGETIGTINWFALHPTNFGEKNKLISGDNKGYAEQLLEKSEGVIAAFANSCCGDISPNAGKDERGNRYGRPDGKHDLERVALFGEKQFEKALELYKNASVELDGEIDYRHTYVDMSQCKIDGTGKRTWPAAMGYGMVNGSMEDSRGLGLNSWGEGTTKYNIRENPALFKRLAKFVLKVFGIKWPKSLPDGYEDGHGAKAIFLPLGYMNYKKTPIIPSVLPLQMFRLGSLLIAAHPGELTTVAGIRMRDQLSRILGKEQGIDEIVIATYSNGFSSYTTTPEEYTVQEYEGASTLYGPFTFPAFLQENIKIAEALRNNSVIEDGAEPEQIPHKKLKKVNLKWIRPDFKADNLDFGQFDESPKSSYKPGDTVSIMFVAGYPNRILKTGDTYFKIHKKLESGFWKTVATDDDFNTQMRWMMRGKASMFRIKWTIPVDVEPGTYRVLFDGPVKFEHDRRKKLLRVTSPEFLVKENA